MEPLVRRIALVCLAMVVGPTLPSCLLIAAPEDSAIYIRMASVVFIKYLQKAPFPCLPRQVDFTASVSLTKLNIRTKPDGTPNGIAIEYSPSIPIGTYLSEAVKSWTFRPVFLDSIRHPTVSTVLIYLIHSPGKPRALVAGYHDTGVTLQYCEN